MTPTALQSARIRWLASVLHAKTEPSRANLAKLRKAEKRYVTLHQEAMHRLPRWPRFRKMPKGANLYPVGNAYKAA